MPPPSSDTQSEPSHTPTSTAFFSRQSSAITNHTQSSIRDQSAQSGVCHRSSSEPALTLFGNWAVSSDTDPETKSSLEQSSICATSLSSPLTEPDGHLVRPASTSVEHGQDTLSNSKESKQSRPSITHFYFTLPNDDLAWDESSPSSSLGEWDPFGDLDSIVPIPSVYYDYQIELSL